MANELITHAQNFIAGGGSASKKLMRQYKATGKMDVGILRTNDTLRHEDWLAIDQKMVGVARQRLIGINDLRNRGLVVNLGGLGVLFSSYERITDMTAAEVDFSAITDGERDSLTFDMVNVPVPIFHKSFQINIRRQAASLRGDGPPIDTVQSEYATIKVVEQLEEVLFNGFTGGSLSTKTSSSAATLYGYTTQTDINTQSGSDWGTAANVQTSLIDAIAKLEADRYFGPWLAYVAPTQFGQLRNFFTDGSGDQVFDRVKRIQGIEGIQPGDRLTDATAVLVSMRSDVVDLAIGQDLTIVEWEEKGGLLAEFKVMAAMAVRVKGDAAGGSGICLLSSI